jgi:chromosome segregation ATPase
MTPQEIRRTMDFILRSQADSVIRMERRDEEIEKLMTTVQENAKAIRESRADLRKVTTDIQKLTKESRESRADIRKLTRESRAHQRRIQSLEKSKYRLEGLRDIMRILTRLTATQSKRLDQLEKT